MSNNNIIGERIKELREQAGEKQEEFGEMIISSQTAISPYSIYEDGRIKPTVDTIAAIAKHYNVSADYILGLTDNVKTPCDLCRYAPPSSSDGKPCCMCTVEDKEGQRMNDDLISRQAAIEKLKKLDWQELYLPIHFKEFILDKLPSVQSKAGHWICDYKGDHVADYHCSECGRQLGFAFSTQNKKILGDRWKYCDVCGARMKGETE